MKSLGLLRIALISAGFASVLVLSPACKGQSEIAPDHFDGTDSWEGDSVAAPQQTVTPYRHRATSHAAAQLIHEHQSSRWAGHIAPATLQRRRVVPHKFKKQ